jgi:hypothetical protein
MFPNLVRMNGKGEAESGGQVTKSLEKREERDKSIR